MTAEEVCSLDLRGCDLVVLSANDRTVGPAIENAHRSVPRWASASSVRPSSLKSIRKRRSLSERNVTVAVSVNGIVSSVIRDAGTTP